MRVGLYNFIMELGLERVAELFGANIECTECPARAFCKKRYKKMEDKYRPLVPEYMQKEAFKGETEEEVLSDLVLNEFVNTSFCEETMVKYFKIGKEVSSLDRIPNGFLQSL